MYEPAERAALADELAEAFLRSPWDAESLAENGAARLDRWPAWMVALAAHVAAVHRAPPLNDPQRLAALIGVFLERSDGGAAAAEAPVILREASRTAAPERPLTPPALGEWRLPAIASVGELAERFELSLEQLQWLADVRGMERTVAAERLRNYRYRAIPRDGDLPRLIEAPKARLKEIQRRLLREILHHVPPHVGAHGFTPGRSVATHAGEHTGQDAVLRTDLKDFFASVPAGRISGIFRTLGYPPPVARVLTGLATNSVPLAVWQRLGDLAPEQAIGARFWLGRQLATPHLPQGAPTSPALANLAAFGLDRRLSGLAQASGLRYSRYADDLTFSGSERLIRLRDRFESIVAAIAREEGFRLNPAKSAAQAAGGRQMVCGVVVNVRPNVRRSDYDRLRATLHNAALHGPDSQNLAGVANFSAHLLGRISWVESLNPDRGRRLRELYGRIDWD